MKQLFKSIVICKVKIIDYMGNEEEFEIHIDEEIDKGGLFGYRASDFRRHFEHQLGELRDRHRKRLWKRKKS